MKNMTNRDLRIEVKVQSRLARELLLTRGFKEDRHWRTHPTCPEAAAFKLGKVLIQTDADKIKNIPSITVSGLSKTKRHTSTTYKAKDPLRNTDNAYVKALELLKFKHNN